MIAPTPPSTLCGRPLRRWDFYGSAAVSWVEGLGFSQKPTINYSGRGAMRLLLAFSSRRFM
ncbi:hypothetical protein AWC17_15550 [Mycobacterium nebraskense]|uniref:Uncharacterized protein n=1 Tax=Mycobacterium nebraskense TaxID=244292 RepID=A0A1X1YYM9_9MYCO|nr:hypothetical protein AWC17_15550 [Mycobacterium nebraskense]